MAKGNMLQGMARGKVGDVVFSRLNGQQISRVRNRQPYNPRTNKQLIQRAIMATTMLAYSAGKEIFNHSFQGKAVGSANQREFMRVNAKHLRSLVADDLNDNVTLTSQKGRVVAPKAVAPTVAPIIISQGSYNQKFFTYASSRKSFEYPNKTQDQTCKQYCIANGLIPGDIYTFVAFTPSAESWYSTVEEALKNQVPCGFHFVRMQVKDNALDDEEAIGASLATVEATAGVPFVITEQSDNGIASAIAFNATNGISLYILGLGENGAIGVIRSRFDEDLRSNSEMYINFDEEERGSWLGIASQYIIDVWSAGATPVGDSDLILEGGDI